MFTCCLCLVYGVDLTTHVKLCSSKLPLVLRQCVMEVESRGMCAYICVHACVYVCVFMFVCVRGMMRLNKT